MEKKKQEYVWEYSIEIEGDYVSASDDGFLLDYRFGEEISGEKYLESVVMTKSEAVRYAKKKYGVDRFIRVRGHSIMLRHEYLLEMGKKGGK